jgi:hypothetical protein
MHDSSTRENHDQGRGRTHWKSGCKEISGCPLFADDDAAKGNNSSTAAFFGH